MQDRACRILATMPQWTHSYLKAALQDIQAAPTQTGTLRWIVRRPAEGEREAVEQAVLSADEGLVGDCWVTRPCRHTPDGQPDVNRQLTLMNVRVIASIAPSPSDWAMAGDQLYVDFDLSTVNAPVGTRLHIGGSLVEITAPPHRGCAKFTRRYGTEAVAFVNAPEYAWLNLRGVNARVVTLGTVRLDDPVMKCDGVGAGCGLCAQA